MIGLCGGVLQLCDESVHLVDDQTRLDPLLPCLLQHSMRLGGAQQTRSPDILGEWVWSNLRAHPFNGVDENNGSITEPHSSGHLKRQPHGVWYKQDRECGVCQIDDTSLEKSTCPGESIRFTKKSSRPMIINTCVSVMSGWVGGGFGLTIVIVQSNRTGLHCDSSQLFIMSAVHVPQLREAMCGGGSLSAILL